MGPYQQKKGRIRTKNPLNSKAVALRKNEKV